MVEEGADEERTKGVLKAVKERGIGDAFRHEHARSIRPDRRTVERPAPPRAARHGPVPVAPFPPQGLRCQLLVASYRLPMAILTD